MARRTPAHALLAGPRPVGLPGWASMLPRVLMPTLVNWQERKRRRLAPRSPAD